MYSHERSHIPTACSSCTMAVSACRAVCMFLHPMHPLTYLPCMQSCIILLNSWLDVHICTYNNSACNGHLHQIVQEIKVLSTLDDVSDDGIFELRAMGGGARRVTSGVTPPPSQLSELRQRRFHSLVR